MKKTSWTKIMAILALFWILISIIWTWALIIYDIYTWWTNNWNQQQEITKEQLNALLKAYSWSLTSSWITVVNSWTVINQDTLTWTWK